MLKNKKKLLSSSGETILPELMTAISLLEIRCRNEKVDIFINSGRRTKVGDLLAGGTGKGEHTFGGAVDIKAITSRDRFVILKEAFGMGFKRVGVYSRHIHLGILSNRAQKVSWYGIYEAKNVTGAVSLFTIIVLFSSTFILSLLKNIK